jgi:hypothetical protein
MANLWFYRQREQTFGPVEAGELRRLARSGILKPTDLVSREAQGRWVPALNVRGLFATTDPKPDQPPPLPATPPLSPRPFRDPKLSRHVRQGVPRAGSIQARTLSSVVRRMSATEDRTNPKSRINTKRLTIGLWVATAIGGMLFAATIVRDVGRANFVLPEKSAPHAETWKNFVDATFFVHYVKSRNPHGPYLLNMAWEYVSGERLSVYHMLAISSADLENTTLVEHPVQGVLKGKYHTFPARSDGVATPTATASSHLSHYAQYDVELRFVPSVRGNHINEKATMWQLRTASITKTFLAGRPVVSDSESLEVGVGSLGGMVHDSRFPALQNLFYEMPFGGYWPRGQVVAHASHDMASERRSLEKGLASPEGPDVWSTTFDFDPREVNSETALQNARERIRSAMQEELEDAKETLVMLPPEYGASYLSSWEVFEYQHLFAQLQRNASRLVALRAIAVKHRLWGYGYDGVNALAEWGSACEVIARATSGYERYTKTLNSKELEQRHRHIAEMYSYHLDSCGFEWDYPPPSVPAGLVEAEHTASAALSSKPKNGKFSVRYEIFSPGPVLVRYRNGLGGWDEKRMMSKQDEPHVIEVTLSRDETANVIAKALDRDAPVSAWIYVDGKRVAVSTDNDGGGTVTCSGNLQSQER